MAITNRKQRSLSREPKQFRDSRLFYIGCDDTYAPKQYFDFFKISRIKVVVVESDDKESAALDVVARLREIKKDAEDGDELWMLLDTDHFVQGAHLKSYTKALSEAEQIGISVAISRPCFELWLLLHHEGSEDVYVLNNAKEVSSKLSSILGGYNKTKLRAEDFPLASVHEACIRAKGRDSTVGGGTIPQETTSRVYLLWKSILERALQSQLPSELVGLLDKLK